MIEVRHLAKRYGNRTAMSDLSFTIYYDLQPDEVLLMDWDTVTAIGIRLDGSATVFVPRTDVASLAAAVNKLILN